MKTTQLHPGDGPRAFPDRADRHRGSLEVGDKAPDFNLPSTKEGKFSLSGVAGKKNVIVQFYVLDFTPT